MASAPVVPSTMRAYLYTPRTTPSKGLRIHTIPTPSASGSNLLVRVQYAALNPADPSLMGDIPWLPFRRSVTPGLDFAGTVVSAGPSAPQNMQPGAAVCGAMNVLSAAVGRGTLSEYVLVPSYAVVPKPETVAWKEAAASGVVGQTVLFMIQTAGVQEGWRVLVNGAAGGVGSVLVQVLRAKKCHVVGICSGGKADFVKSLGANETVDYTRQEPLSAYMTDVFAKEPFDCILDTIRVQDLYLGCAPFLKEGGKYVNIGNKGGTWRNALSIARNHLVPTWLGGVPRTYTGGNILPNATAQAEVVKWLEDGDVKIHVDMEIGFDEVLKGYERVQSARAMGKVIVRVLEE